MHLKKQSLLLFIISLQLLLLTACQSSHLASASPPALMGRYIESDFDELNALIHHNNFNDIFIDSNGQPNIYLYENNTLEGFTFNKKHEISQINRPWFDTYNKWVSQTQAPANLISHANDSDLYFISYPEDFQIKISKLVGQSVQDIPIYWQKVPHHLLAEAVTNQHNLLFLSSDGILSQYSGSTGRFMNKYSDSTFCNFEIYKDTAICVSDKDKKLMFLNTDTFSVTKDLPLPSTSYHALIQVDPLTGDIYFLNGKGIWHLTQTSTVWEQLVDGNLCSLASVSLGYMHFIVYNNEFIIQYTASNPTRDTFKILSYSDTTPTRPDKEITVYSLYGDTAPKDSDSYGPYTYPLRKSFLPDALNRYQLSHPDVYFKYVTGTNESTTREQAIQTLNTELLSGQGPDILILDELPIQSYGEQNILTDLSNCIKPLADSNQILSGINTAYQYNEKIYTTPLRFAFTTIWGDDSILQQVHSLHDLALYKRMHPKEPLYQYEEPDYLIWLFYPILSSSNSNSSPLLDKAALRTFLEDIKTLSYNGEDYELRSSHWITDGSALLVNHCKVHATLTAGMDYLENSAYANKHFDNYSYKLFPDNSHSAFEGLSLFSINANSPYQDTCKDLLQTLLSEDYQDHIFLDGFPVNKASFKKLLYGEFTKNNRPPYSFLATSGTNWDEIKYSDGNWKDYLDIYQNIYSACEKLSTPSNMDTYALDIIIADSKPYFDGLATLDSVTDKIYNKLILYSKEH